jgi:ABC-type sugar transport system substrate-binding protein
MHRLSRTGLAALVVVAALAAGCGSSSKSSSSSSTASSGSGSTTTAAAKKVHLTLILNDLTNPVSVPLRKGAEDAAKELGFDLKIVGPNPATAQEQINTLQNVQTQKPDGIVILPVDTGALTPAIDRAVAAGIPVATTELDAPKSKRSFFYFGGDPPLDQGKMSADKVFETLKSEGAKGTVNFVVTSCLPTVEGQQQRRSGFEDRVKELNASSSFQLKEAGFYNTTTDPAKNLANIKNIYTAKGSSIQVAYAMCGPDTQNWGTVLKQKGNKKVLVAGYDWLPETLNLIEQGWVRWSLGSSLYDEGHSTFKTMYEHAANGKALPTGFTHGKSTYATKDNLTEVRASPDVQATK